MPNNWNISTKSETMQCKQCIQQNRFCKSVRLQASAVIVQKSRVGNRPSLCVSLFRVTIKVSLQALWILATLWGSSGAVRSLTQRQQNTTGRICHELLWSKCSIKHKFIYNQRWNLTICLIFFCTYKFINLTLKKVIDW